MPMYSKRDMEFDLDILEFASQRISAQVIEREMAGDLCAGLWAQEQAAKLLVAERRIRGKYFRTRQLMADIRFAKHGVQEAQNDLRNGRAGEEQLQAAERGFQRCLRAARGNESPYAVPTTKAQGPELVQEIPPAVKVA